MKLTRERDDVHQSLWLYNIVRAMLDDGGPLRIITEFLLLASPRRQKPARAPKSWAGEPATATATED